MNAERDMESLLSKDRIEHAHICLYAGVATGQD